MGETKFTKGEWEIKPIESDREYIRIRGEVCGGRFKIADIHHLSVYRDGESDWCKRQTEESLANAYLFKAAPKLYAELQSFLDDGDLQSFVHDRIEKLLAEARGEDYE